MTTYYKATRPDGRDFHTGTVDYAAALASGEVLRHPGRYVGDVLQSSSSKARLTAINGQRVTAGKWVKLARNDPSTYFSVSIEPADCTGMSWPCRLFRVEPVGRVIHNDNLPNKRCCSALRVVEELPAWQALGPNGEAVAAFIGRCRTLTPDQVKKLAAARDAAWYAAWDAARDAARDAAWYAAGDAAWDAARDAAWVIVVRDKITADQYATLVRPFVDAGLREWVE